MLPEGVQAIWPVFALSTALCVGLLGPGSCTLATGAQQVGPQKHHQLPKLFDFNEYKRDFAKTYSSLAEEMNRKRLFFCSALNAFASGVMYKFRRQSYYEAVNHWSDWSREELARMNNKQLGHTDWFDAPQDFSGDAEKEGEQEEDKPEFVPGENEDVEAEIFNLIETHANEPGFDELKRELDSREHVRHKRDAPQQLPPRDFSFDKLIASKESKEPGPAKKAVKVASNNPNYRPVELASYGWLAEAKLQLNTYEVTKIDPRPVSNQLLSCLSESKRGARKGAPEEEAAPRKKVSDLRSSPCMPPPRAQKVCGSCYAFATIAIFEYLYCMKTGNPVQFSEQYIIDCGKLVGLKGCGGGDFWRVVNFVNKYGLELRSNYPYVASEIECPYDKKSKKRHTGYIRMPIKKIARVDILAWPDVLEHGPLWVTVKSGPDLYRYGGGVYNGKLCGKEPSHAMVLVGHKVEDGAEYWILRNSHGERWGERGYWYLTKRATGDCICLDEVFALGTKDGLEYKLEPRLTESRTGGRAGRGSVRAVA